MGHLRRDIEHAVLLVQHVHIFGEGFPAPFDAFGERCARNVLDAFHQLDEPVVLVGAGGGKADAAVAHDDRGHAMPARRCDQRIPRHLTIVMCVNVDPARRHDMAGCINLAFRSA